MKSPIFRALVALALVGAVGAVQAEKADRNKPINVEAETGSYDGVRQVGVFMGRVVLTKGSILIRGERVETREDAQGYQYAVVQGGGGERAFYRQKQDGVDEYIEGEAASIEYDGRADTVRFVQKAELRRLRGAALADEARGELIVYESLNNRVSVDGATKSTTGAPTGRLRMMITPQQTPASAPAGEANQPSPTLKPSGALGGAPK